MRLLGGATARGARSAKGSVNCLADHGALSAVRPSLSDTAATADAGVDQCGPLDGSPLKSKTAPEGPFASNALVAGACYPSKQLRCLGKTLQNYQPLSALQQVPLKRTNWG